MTARAMGCIPSAWRKVRYLVVSGLTEAAFVDGSLLLAVSHQEGLYPTGPRKASISSALRRLHKGRSGMVSPAVTTPGMLRTDSMRRTPNIDGS